MLPNSTADLALPGTDPGKRAVNASADNLKRGSRDSDDSVRQQFCYFDKGSMATIGRSAAVASPDIRFGEK
jgi:hypothetical protein